MTNQKPRKIKSVKWYLVGWLPDGEAIYCSEYGRHAVEKDYSRLVEITPEEAETVIAYRPAWSAAKKEVSSD